MSRARRKHKIHKNKERKTMSNGSPKKAKGNGNGRKEKRRTRGINDIAKAERRERNTMRRRIDNKRRGRKKHVEKDDKPNGPRAERAAGRRRQGGEKVPRTSAEVPPDAIKRGPAQDELREHRTGENKRP